MKIELRQIKIQNFKKFKNLEVNFEHETFIHGANRAGKTSILDAFLWLLFGVDSFNRSDFEIKSKDEKGNTIPKTEVNVEAILLIDGVETQIGRTLKEVWSSVKNSTETYFKGNKTVYSWNKIDGIKESEFNQKRDAIVSKDLFKLITSVTHFNTLTPKLQREMLMSLIPDIQNETILSKIKSSDYLEHILSSGESLENAKKSLQGKIKAIKDELKSIPIRIDENEKSKPEGQNWDDLRLKLESLEFDLKKIEEQINDKSKIISKFNESRIDEQKRLNNLKLELNEFKNKLTFLNNEKINKADSEINDLKDRLNKIEYYNNILLDKNISINSDIEFIEQKRQDLLKEYKQVKASTFVFDVSQGKCNSCGKTLDNVDEIKVKAIKDFEENRTKNLDRIKAAGSPLTQKAEGLKKDIEKNNLTILDNNKSISEIQEKMDVKKVFLEKLKGLNPLDDAKYIKDENSFKALLEAFESVEAPTVDTLELKKEKANIIVLIDGVKTQLGTKKTIEDIDVRIQELKEKEKNQVAEIMKLEKDLNSVESFSFKKVEILEAEVNKLFNFTQFQMFETAINGNISEVCKASYNGITYNSLNNEARINVGLDIINVFSKHNDIYCPIFIDNRESVTEIIETESQVINLVVDAECKEIKVI